MSLNTSTTLFAGHDQFDVASLVTPDGIHYECFIWLNRAQYRIEAWCQRSQVSGGEPVLVFHNYVVAPANAGTTNGYPLDSPRIIAVGTTFVVHWLESTLVDEGVRDWQLFRASMNMEAFSSAVGGWTAHSSVGIHDLWAQYDACPVLGSDTDFVVARSTAADEITVQRFIGFQWLDDDWLVTIDREHTPRCLGVYAHDSDNDIIVSYERTDGANALELWSAHLDADDGGSFADVKTFNDLADANFVQVGHCRVGTNRVAVVAECLLESSRTAAVEIQPSVSHIHLVAYREINSDTAARVSFEHWVNNAYMVSHPWSYSDGATVTGVVPNVYCCIAYRSVYLTSEWEQAAIFAVNLHYAQWGDFSAGQTIRPHVMATYVNGSVPDARTSAWHPESLQDLLTTFGSQKRVNHISRVSGAPPYGPDIKTRTVAVGTFARMGTVAAAAVDPYILTDGIATEFQPQNLGCSEFKIYLEDPQTIFRDESDPTQPVDNFKAPFARTTMQTCPVGKSLFVSGGAPALYDGEQLVECGFLWRPELYALDPQNHASGEMTSGTTVQYYAVYSWRDSQGQVHRSGPSRIMQVTLGGSDDSVRLYCRTMSMSLKDNEAFYPLAEDIQIEVFRSSGAATDGLFYRCFGQMVGVVMRVQDTPLNDPTATSVPIDDLVSDADIVLQGLGPYQYGADQAEGLVGPFPQTSPALTCCTNWLNRVIAVDALDPTTLWYTDESFADFGTDFAQAPFFTDDLTYRIGDIGEVVALQAMNNALFAFTATDIYGLTGTDAGGGLLNIQSERIHAGTGCIEPRSVCLGPDGIFFQASKGYYLLARNRELEYIGADVEDEIREAGNVRNAIVLEDRTQLRVTCNGRPVTTWTTVLTVATGEFPLGTWEVELVGYDGLSTIGLLEADNDMTDEIIANNLAADISVLIDAGTLDGIILSATPDGDEVTIVWAPDVVPSYALTAPGGNALTGVDTSEIATYPRVLIYDTLRKMWSRAELVQTHGSLPRMAEVVSGCAWRLTSGEMAHCVLTQGVLLVERATTDPLLYADETDPGDTVGIPIDVKTGWLHFAGVAGYQRIKSIGIQARRHGFNFSDYSVDLEYCRDGNYDVPELETGLTVITDSPSYMRVRPSIQKASAVRVRVYEDGASSGENISLVNLIFELGIKPGPRRVAATQIAT